MYVVFVTIKMIVILCFANLKVKVNKSIMLSKRFNLNTHNLCKNKWIIKYTLKFQASLFSLLQ